MAAPLHRLACPVNSYDWGKRGAASAVAQLRVRGRARLRALLPATSEGPHGMRAQSLAGDGWTPAADAPYSEYWCVHGICECILVFVFLAARPLLVAARRSERWGLPSVPPLMSAVV